MADSKNFALGFIMGSLVGAAVALLCAPAAGEETRGRIRGATDDACSKTVDLVNKAGEAVAAARDTAADYVRPAVDAAGQTAEEVKHRTTDVIDAATGFVHTQTGQVKTAAQPVVEAVANTVGHIKDSVAHLRHPHNGSEGAVWSPNRDAPEPESTDTLVGERAAD